MKKKWLLAAVVVMLVVVSWSASRNLDSNRSYDMLKDQVILREIGHRILLSAGDTVSRVLPVQQTGDNIYDIRFESPFSFKPDSLVRIINQAVSLSHFSRNYAVSVLQCNSNDIIYGYAMQANGPSDIIPCLTRTAEKSCYKVRIVFARPGTIPGVGGYAWWYIIGGCLLAALAGYYRVRGKKKTRLAADDLTQITDNNFIPLGQLRFYPDQQVIMHGEEAVSLTVKEAKLLKIFAACPNQLIDRNRLLKEGWEDEGVITGRSLDMFVSRLRKKLQQDPSVTIAGVHGKGYRLDISI